MYTEVLAVYCKNDTKHLNVLFVKKVLFNVKSVVHIVNSRLKRWRKWFVIHTLFIYLSTQNVQHALHSVIFAEPVFSHVCEKVSSQMKARLRK